MSGIFVKFIITSSGVSALALAFWRDITTFAVLLAGVGLLRPSRLRVRRRDLPWLVALGISVGFFHVFWNLGVALNGAAVTTIQQAAMPVIVTIVAWLLWQEPLTWNKILAIILTFVGTVLVSGLGELDRADVTLGGLLVGFGLPISYASWNLFGKKMREQYDALIVLTYAFGAGALVLLPLQFFTPQPFPVPLVTYFWFAGLIGIATLTGFAAYTFGLGRLPASVTSILAMTEIAFVVVFAYLLLGEWMTVSQLVGAVMVVGGVMLLIWRRRKARRAS
jgi:drug/metabolite transporter (DMT)-like permease